MATTDRLTPWNIKHNFCALYINKDYFPSGPRRDLEFAQVTRATLDANKIIRQLLGGTLGLGREPMHFNCRAKAVPMPSGFERIVKTGTKWFIPHPMKEVWAECPRCGTMNHFVRTSDVGQYFVCTKCS